MAIVEMFTQTRWSCSCGNLFGVSGHPITVRVAQEMTDRLCDLCGTCLFPHPSIHPSIARPPLG